MWRASRWQWIRSPHELTYQVLYIIIIIGMMRACVFLCDVYCLSQFCGVCNIRIMYVFRCNLKCNIVLYELSVHRMYTYFMLSCALDSFFFLRHSNLFQFFSVLQMFQRFHFKKKLDLALFRFLRRQKWITNFFLFASFDLFQWTIFRRWKFNGKWVDYL